MKQHPRQNITLKIYSVSDDTANRLMTALGKLLHSRPFTRKAERWKLFRSTPPKNVFFGLDITCFDPTAFNDFIRERTGEDYPRASVGHQMAIAGTSRKWAGCAATPTRTFTFARTQSPGKTTQEDSDEATHMDG